MHYYAIINEEYTVMEVISSDTIINDDWYIEITEEQYNDEGFIGSFYDQDKNEFVGGVMWVGTTNEIRYDETYRTLTGKLNEMDEKIDTHTHDGYVSSGDLQVLEDVIDTKADANHQHSGYASANHGHSEYATTVALDTLDAEINEKADADHSHSEYALSSHEHDYAEVGHNHNSSYAPISHNHNNYVSTTDFDALEVVVDGKSDSSHTHTNYSEIGHNHDSDYSNINHNHNSAYSSVGHDHDSDYAPLSHSHNDVYYTESEIDTKLATKSDSSHNHTGVYDASGSAASALSSANSYTDSKIDALIGEGASTTLDTIGEIATAIEDNQDMIDTLNSAIGNKANATDLTSHTGNTTIHVTSSERESWNAKSNFSGNYNDLTNKPTIPSISGLATVTYVDAQIDAIDVPSALSDLTTDSTHRVVTDAEKSAWNAKSNFSGSYNDLTNKPSIPSVSGLATETYVDEAVSGKANSSHSHTIANITNLQSALDGKAAVSHGTHVNYSTTAPVVDGTASVGTATTVARSDHKHPTDTSRAAQASLDSHTSNKSNPHGVTLAQLGVTATATELNALDGITATVTEINYVDGVTSNIQTQLNDKAANSHTHSYAGSSSVGGAATSANKLNTNAGSTTQPVYFANGIPVACTYTLSKSVPSDAKFTDTTYGVATTSANGLMSASDKSKLDGMVLATVSEVETYLGI